MSVVAERLSQVSLGEPRVHKNLVMFPLIADGNVEPRYQLLDDALAQGSARVTEVSESGSVPELKFVNEGERPVLLLDGEELVGAKQNRILNLRAPWSTMRASYISLFSACGKMAAQARNRGKETSFAHLCGVAVRLSNDNGYRSKKNLWNRMTAFEAQ